MHGFFEINCIQNFDFIWFVYNFSLFVPHDFSILIRHRTAFCQHTANLQKHSSLRISNHIRAVHLHNVRLYKKSGFSRTRTANYQNVFIPGVFRILWSAWHSKTLCFCENNIIFKFRIRIWSYIFFYSPSGRTILHTQSIFPGIFRAVNNNKLYSHAACDSTQQIYMIQTWPEILKRQFKISNGIHKFIPGSCSGVYPIQPGNLIEKIGKHQIGEIS